MLKLYLYPLLKDALTTADENACSQIMHDNSNGLRDNPAYSAISEGLVTDLHPEDGRGPSSQNTNSEKCDFDSVGQEFKAMMNFLLPQAVPLLKKVPRKKKATVGGSQTFRCQVNPQEETNKTSTFMDASSPGTAGPFKSSNLYLLKSSTVTSAGF